MVVVLECKANQLGIIWGQDDNYWRISEEEAYLKLVYYFQVDCTFMEVPAGRYNVVVYAEQKKNSSAFSFDCLSFPGDEVKKTAKNCSSEYMSAEGVICATFDNETTNNIPIRLSNIDCSTYKTGLSIYKIQLESISHFATIKSARSC